MHKRLLILMIVVCLIITPTLAQDAQPDQAFIISSASEVIFPQAIRFQVTLARVLTDLSAASLLIEPQGQSPISVDLNLQEAAVIGDPYAELAYIWMIPRDNPPRLFQEIRFRWRVVTTANEIALMENSLMFTDQRAQWVQDTRGPIQLAMPASGPLTTPALVATAALQAARTPLANAAAGAPAQSNVATIAPLTGLEALTPQFGMTASGPQPTLEFPPSTGIGQIQSSLEPVYDLLSANTGQVTPLRIIIYTDAFPPECITNTDGDRVAVGPSSGTEIACDDMVAEAVFRSSGFEVARSNSSSLNRIQVVLTDFLTGRLYEPLWQGKAVPDWFRSGLAQMYAPALKTALYPTLSAAARNNTLFPLTDGAADSNANNLWDAQSYGLVLYIADQIGLAGLFELANVPADSFAEAYQSAMGKPISTLIDDLKRWIFTDRATAAFSFSVYQAITPTPTMTRTLTPTLTPTATPSMTSTFTPTVTGVLTATPLPTATFPRTPTAAPPTRTPRPAGSLNTPTPVVEPAVNPLGNLGTPTVALGILTIGLVLIAAFALILLRPRRK